MYTLDLYWVHIFLNDINFLKIDNYADDKTLHAYNKNVKAVICNLIQGFFILSNWFHGNYMVQILEKSPFMLFGLKKIDKFDLMCNNITLKHSIHEKG